MTDSSVQHARRTANASLNIFARCERSTPKACCSCGSATPRPKAGRSLPPDMRSSVASSFARTMGLRPGRTMTLMPIFNFCVRAAAIDIATSGSGATPPMRSLSHKLSNRRRSRVSTTSRKLVSLSFVRTPRPNPTRTFTFPCLHTCCRAIASAHV